jgi:hypothetical protein
VPICGGVEVCRLAGVASFYILNSIGSLVVDCA